MAETIKEILSKFVTNVTSGTRIVGYVGSTYPVEVSSTGSVGVDAVTLVNSSEAQKHIAAIRKLHKASVDSE